MEVMISLVILAIGVMGVIGLQMSTYQQLQTSHNYSKAAMLASDMADRMLANRDQAPAYAHSAPTPKPTPDCAVADCTPAQLAAYDVWYWQAELHATDPDDDALREPGTLPSASGEVKVNAAGQYLVLVRWDDDLSGLDEEVDEDACAALDPLEVQDPKDRDCYALNLGCLGVACP